jgi:hypothetical protein
MSVELPASKRLAADLTSQPSPAAAAIDQQTRSAQAIRTELVGAPVHPYPQRTTPPQAFTLQHADKLDFSLKGNKN